MINFRYHIVSLMAVFLALSVGIGVGVTLRPSVDSGLRTQADQDRRQVQELRAELDRRAALDRYRDAWASGTRDTVTAGILSNQRVALILMPDAPAEVADAVTSAVTDAGATLTATVEVGDSVFDPAEAPTVAEALDPYARELASTPAMSPATRVGRGLGRALLTKTAGDRDGAADQLRRSMTRAGLVSIDENEIALAQLAVVITAEAVDPPVSGEIVDARAELEVALKAYATGVVLAGPNSDGLEGTDVQAVRLNGRAASELSTVDVADLPSGVITVVLAGREQLLGREGHYGALGGADAPSPELPVR